MSDDPSDSALIDSSTVASLGYGIIASGEPDVLSPWACKATQYSAPHPISLTLFFLLHPDLALSSFWPQNLPSDCLTSTHAPSSPTRNGSLQRKLCRTKFLSDAAVQDKTQLFVMACKALYSLPFQNHLEPAAPRHVPTNNLLFSQTT